MTRPEAQIPGARVPDPGAPAPRHPVERPSREELEGVRRREPEALGRFFDRYFDRIHGLAYRLLGDRPAAEDVAQEVFLKVHRACDRLDPERSLRAFAAALVLLAIYTASRAVAALV